jgi:hypothetical protein
MNISVIDLRNEYIRALSLWPFLPGYEQFARLPRMMLFAVGSRETNLDPAYTHGRIGDGGHGHGVWQLDDRSHHIPIGFDTDVHIQSQTAAEMLVSSFELYHDWLSVLAVYNSGQTNDAYTTGHDYAHDVLARMEALQMMYPANDTVRLIVPQNPPMVGNDVLFYQQAMNIKHFWGTPLTADGIYGPKSIAAVKHFQGAHGLRTDGIIGPATRQAMAQTPIPR